MFAQAIDINDAGRCGRHQGVDLRDLRELWREMTSGREGGPGEYGESYRGGRGRHGGHRHRGRSGPRGDSGGQFGGFGPGGWRGRGRKARRGDIRTAALLLLAEEPRNGYQIMQEVQERSGDVWRPSPGSVYPALQQLEDEGLIRSEEIEGRRLFKLTDAGRAYLDERDPDARAPWEQPDGEFSDQVFAAKCMKEIAFAFAQLMRSGSDDQLAKARDVLAVTRRDLYRILADEEPGERAPGDGDGKDGDSADDDGDAIVGGDA
jgi:DNA-binding PadR family transcriptional regulator